MSQVTFLIVKHPTPMTSPMQVTLQGPNNPSEFHQTKLTIASGSAFSGTITKSSTSGAITVPSAEFTNIVSALATVPPDQLPLTLTGTDNGLTFTVTGWVIGSPIHPLLAIREVAPNITANTNPLSEHLNVSKEILGELRKLNERMESFEQLLQRERRHSSPPMGELKTGNDP